MWETLNGELENLAEEHACLIAKEHGMYLSGFVLTSICLLIILKRKKFENNN